jgi:hypothetical protein
MATVTEQFEPFPPDRPQSSSLLSSRSTAPPIAAYAGLPGFLPGNTATRRRESALRNLPQHQTGGRGRQRQPFPQSTTLATQMQAIPPTVEVGVMLTAYVVS